jgi:hypothetical protein
MKPSHVKAAVVVAVTAVGADVRAAGEAVTVVEVVAEDATNNFLIIAVVPPLPVLRMLRPRIQAALLAISSNCGFVSFIWFHSVADWP